MAEQTEHFRVQWIDTDAGGRIHFTAAFRWAEATELALYRKVGVPRDRIGHFPRRQVQAEYHRTLVFDDELDLTLRVERIGRTSLTFGWIAVHDGDIAIEGRHTVVQVDEMGRPAVIDHDLRAKLD